MINKEIIKLRVFDWQYYWHYRIQLKLKHEDAHGWAFYALWAFNTLIFLGFMFIFSRYFESAKTLLSITGKGEILLIIGLVLLSFLMTRYIYGNEQKRIQVVNNIEEQGGIKRYAWFAVLYPVIAMLFCLYMFYLSLL